ncbi:phage portal protein [Acrocarpospora sp. B8E8]|uniref:phage portal protein n=1 Tax=Acrocarpospora sp. B8E8 TaxID=3153572 RepID=UPI00325EF262
MSSLGSPPASPAEWITYLDGRLATNQTQLRRYADYYDSTPLPLAFQQARFQEAFQALFATWRVNFGGLIVDSISERLKIDGFRMTEDPEADADAWEMWQRNGLDADSNAAHIDTLALSASYVVVWGEDGSGEDGPEPVISPESAMEVAVQYKPGSRRELMAALKRYRDDWGREYATLWTPDHVHTSAVEPKPNQRINWNDIQTTDNPLGVVPVVPLYNRTRLLRTPFSELEPCIPLIDAVTKVAADAIVASEYAAFPQRYIAGMEIEEDENGKAKSQFQIAIDRILMAEDPATVFGQFAAADLQNYVHLINALVQQLASISRIPFHYFLLNGGQAPSGEAITSAEAGLVNKARERMIHFGEAWERVMRLAFQVKGDKRAKAFDAEVIWADPEYQAKGAMIDGAVKLAQGLDVPKAQLWMDVGYSPQQIARFPELRQLDYEMAIEKADTLGLNPDGSVPVAAQNTPASAKKAVDEPVDKTVAKKRPTAKAA